jgi:hypothetical protein
MKLNDVNVVTTSKFIRLATFLLLVGNESYEYGALNMARHSFPLSITANGFGRDYGVLMS